MTDESSAAKLRRSRNEPEVFADFYRQHFDQVLRFLTRRSYDAEVGLDLTAETFAQAFSGRHRFRGRTQEQAEAWLFQIARRQFNRYVRRGKLETKAIRRLGENRPNPGLYDRARYGQVGSRC